MGFAEVAIHDDEPHPVRVSRRYGHLQSLVVTERSRRQGAGNRLLAAAEEWARKHGATEMQLDTWEPGPTPLPFYEQHGYATLRRKLAKPLVPIRRGAAGIPY